MLASAFAWSVDDKHLLISSDLTGVFNVYRLHTDTGETEPLTNSDVESCFVASGFPLDERLLYTADKGGNEISHLYVREANGDVIDLTPGEQVKAMFAGWSKDRRHFFVTTNARDPQAFDLYQYRTDNYESELVFQNEGLFLVTSLDGERYIALAKNHSNADTDLYLLDSQANEPEPRLITGHLGDIEHRTLSFTRDGRFLIYGSNEHGEYQEAWSYDVKTGDRARLITADWDVAHVGFSDSGRYRIVAVNADGRSEISILDQQSDAVIELPDLPPGDIGSIQFSREENKVVVLLSSDTSPNDVYVVDLKAGQSRRLTRALNPLIQESDLVTTEVVRYVSYDQLDIPGILYKPQFASAEEPCAALVYVHGGPGGQSRCGYNPVIQHLVNHGFAVLAANNRGSSGYGKTFFHMADRRHGELDLDDIVWAEKYLSSLDWIDSSRIGIVGGSYGGYMVGAALAFRPDVFKAGINIFGVMNWLRTLKSIPAWWGADRDALYDLMGDPETDEERLTRISPLFHARNIRVPLLVVQGANDPRVLQAESDEIVAAVRANDVAVEYVLFDDEGHGFTKRANRIAASEAYVDFLNSNL